MKSHLEIENISNHITSLCVSMRVKGFIDIALGVLDFLRIIS